MKLIGWIIAGAALLGVIIGLVYGWIMNIVNLIDGTYESLSTIIIGFIGVIIPFVGALVHYIAG